MRFSLFIITFFLSLSVFAQSNRVKYNGQDLFFNGTNVAWKDFARDVGSQTDGNQKTVLAWFKTMIDDVHAAGGNSFRWWLHVNGEFNPVWDIDSVGVIEGVSPQFFDDMQDILDYAESKGVMANICLWSFDMLKDTYTFNDGPLYGKNVNEYSEALLTDTKNIDIYINRVLVPMVERFKDHKAVMCWEIFNEPEGMVSDVEWGAWPDSKHVPFSVIQRFINLTSGAIHRTDPNALVSSGSWCMKAMTDIQTTDIDEDGNVFVRPKGFNYNYYRDDRLIAEGGDPLGTLDFYQVHYYDWQGQEYSPFHHNASYWQLDKPIVVAEFYPQYDLHSSHYGWKDYDFPDPIDKEDFYEKIYENGYAGVWAWQYNEQWADGIKDGIEKLKGKDGVSWTPQYEVKVNAFDAAVYYVEAGDEINLQWDVENSTSLTLNGTAVDEKGTHTQVINENTDFELVADGFEGPITKTITIEIYTPVFSGVEVSPAFSEIKVGEAIELTATPIDQYGNPYESAVQWDIVTGGTVSSETTNSVTYTSDGTEGTFVVVANSGGFTSEAIITANNCTSDATPLPDGWKAFASWGDPAGFEFSSADDALNLTVPANKGDHTFVVKEEEINVNAGVEYILDINYKNDFGAVIESIEFDLIEKGYDNWSLKNRTSLVAAAGTVDHAAFSNLSAVLTAPATGVYHIGIKINYVSQPNTELNLQFKDIKLCDVKTGADASLKSLTVDQGTLSPAFQSDLFVYENVLGNDVTSQPLYTAIANDDNATVEVVDSENGYITITVTAEAGNKQVYYIKQEDKEPVVLPVVQSITLKEGWNLVSLYVTPSQTETATVFPNAGIVKTFDQFYSSKQDPFLNTLPTVSPAQGYLVFNTKNETISVSGTLEPFNEFTLQDGWNLIGIVEDITIEEYVNKSGAIVVKDFEGFFQLGNTLNSLTELKAGQAYFVKK